MQIFWNYGFNDEKDYGFPYLMDAINAKQSLRIYVLSPALLALNHETQSLWEGDYGHQR